MKMAAAECGHEDAESEDQKQAVNEVGFLLHRNHSVFCIRIEMKSFSNTEVTRRDGIVDIIFPVNTQA
jgi:hypothetical protein